MATEAIRGFQISGYFSRISARKSGPVRALVSKVRRTHEEPFDVLCAVYKTFNRSYTPENSKILAKQIVESAVREDDAEDSLVKTTGQMTNAILSNWIRDRKRNTLARDIRVAIQDYLYRKQFTREVGRCRQYLSSLQGEDDRSINLVLIEKKQAHDQLISSYMEDVKKERACAECRLKVVRHSIAEAEGLKDPEKISGSSNEEKRLYKEAQRRLREVLRPEEAELLNRISNYDSRLDDLSCQVSPYNMDTISAYARDIIDRARRVDIVITPEQLVPITLPDESRHLLIHAFNHPETVA